MIAVTFAAVGGMGLYEAHHASVWRDQVQTLQQQQTSLTEQIERLSSNNQSLSSRSLLTVGERPARASWLERLWLLELSRSICSVKEVCCCWSV